MNPDYGVKFVRIRFRAMSGSFLMATDATPANTASPTRARPTTSVPISSTTLAWPGTSPCRRRRRRQRISGVGQILCQWGRALGAKVIGTVGSEEKAKLAKKKVGARHVILYHEEDFAKRVEEITKGQPAAA